MIHTFRYILAAASSTANGFDYVRYAPQAPTVGKTRPPSPFSGSAGVVRDGGNVFFMSLSSVQALAWSIARSHSISLRQTRLAWRQHLACSFGLSEAPH